MEELNVGGNQSYGLGHYKGPKLSDKDRWGEWEKDSQDFSHLTHSPCYLVPIDYGLVL